MITLEKIKDHFKRNKKYYIVGAAAFAGGVAVAFGATKLAAYLARQKNVEMYAKQANNALINWKPRQTINQVKVDVIERSTPSKPAFDHITKKLYDSINQMSRLTGRTRADILKDPNVEILAVA